MGRRAVPAGCPLPGSSRRRERTGDASEVRLRGGGASATRGLVPLGQTLAGRDASRQGSSRPRDVVRAGVAAREAGEGRASAALPRREVRRRARPGRPTPGGGAGPRVAAEPSGLPAGEGTGVRGIAPRSPGRGRPRPRPRGRGRPRGPARPGAREVRPLRGDHAHHGRARRLARSRAGERPGASCRRSAAAGSRPSPSGSPRRRGRRSSSPPPRTRAWSGRDRPELVRALAASGPRLPVVDPGLPPAGIADAIRWEEAGSRLDEVRLESRAGHSRRAAGRGRAGDGRPAGRRLPLRRGPARVPRLPGARHRPSRRRLRDARDPRRPGRGAGREPFRARQEADRPRRRSAIPSVLRSGSIAAPSTPGSWTSVPWRPSRAPSRPGGGAVDNELAP